MYENQNNSSVFRPEKIILEKSVCWKFTEKKKIQLWLRHISLMLHEKILWGSFPDTFLRPEE